MAEQSKTSILPAVTSDWFSDGVVKFDRTLSIPLSEDAHLIVVAYGTNSDLKLDTEVVDRQEFDPVPTIIQFL